MKTIFAAVCLLSPALASPVQAKGCIKGAIVGGVAGDMAGHGKLGAAEGCAVDASLPDEESQAAKAIATRQAR